MPFQNCGQVVPFPCLLPFDNNGLAISNYTLSTSGNKLGIVFQAPISGYLDKVLFCPGTVSINAASRLRVSFQSVNVSGNPSLVQDQWSDNVPTTNTSFLTASLKAANGSQRAVAMGELVGVVFEFGNFNAADSIQLPRGNINGYSRLCAEEHVSDYTLSTLTWSKNFQMPACSIQYTDGNFYPMLQGSILGPSTAVVNQAFNSGSSPNEIGLIFQLPFPAQIAGAAFFGFTATGGDFIWSLYDSNTNLLTSYTYRALRDVDHATKIYRASRFPNVVNLAAGTTYRLTLKPQTGNNITFTYDNFGSQSYQQGKSPFLPTWEWTQRTNAGAWTQNNLTPQIYLLLTGFAGSAQLSQPMLGGGMQ